MLELLARPHERRCCRRALPACQATASRCALPPSSESSRSTTPPDGHGRHADAAVPGSVDALGALPLQGLHVPGAHQAVAADLWRAV